jgi:hypothetical protein
MNKLKKGPELKPPAFLADFYYDLRDRRLLLPIALVLVAIAAVPFLIGSDPEPLPPLPAQSAAALEAATAGTSSLTVVESTPGLRDYRKRLKGRSKSDPFKQQSTQSAAGGGVGGGGGGAASSSSSASSSFKESVTVEDGSTTVEVEPGDSGGDGGDSPSGGDEGGSPSGSGGNAPGGSGLRLIEFRFNIQISRTEETANGGQKMGEPQVRRRVRALTQLPGKQAPVVTVAGVNLHNGKAFFLVSDDVRSLDGEFVCKTRTPDGICELLEIEAGFPLELVYGPNRVRYRFKVTKIDAVWAGKPGAGASSTRAAFGGPALDALPTR